MDILSYVFVFMGGFALGFWVGCVLPGKGDSDEN